MPEEAGFMEEDIACVMSTDAWLSEDSGLYVMMRQ